MYFRKTQQSVKWKEEAEATDFEVNRDCVIRVLHNSFVPVSGNKRKVPPQIVYVYCLASASLSSHLRTAATPAGLSPLLELMELLEVLCGNM